ncbi:MAG: YmdB family metallophosphoesterase [Neomegalonema sp.]|nr:YmdB family metallophosphoesterase [Neomegalonema sp.]
MRILFLGDFVGRVGRDAAIAAMPALRAELEVDFLIANAENAAAGYGLTPKIANEIFAAGADAITLGNHAFDQRELIKHLDQEPRIIKPLNWPRTSGRGAHLFEISDGRAAGKKVLVCNLLGRVFMNPVDDPFSAVDGVLREYPLGVAADAIVIDMHAEATSEKMAMGHWCDGRASLVVGTHTHVPTGDAQILAKGTGYMTDAGMCGAYDSVIGMDKLEPMKRFITGLSSRAEPAQGEATVSGVLVETDDASGLATRIAPLRRGGQLQDVTPTVR